VDGGLDRDGLMITVQNHTGNKLDWFLRTNVKMSTKQIAGGYTRVTLDIEIIDDVPSGEPDYILGDGSIVPVGGYRAMVAAYLPGWASNEEISGAPTILYGPDGPMRVMGTRVDVLRGGKTSFKVAFDAPPGHHIELLPSGRFFPTPIHVDGKVYSEDSGRSIPI
jgi:hypothetical protein